MVSDVFDESYCWKYCNEHRVNCRCGAVNIRCQASKGNGVHYAEMRCPQCDRHNGWIPKPDCDKAKRPAAHRNLVKKSGIKKCQMCLRHERELVSPDCLHAHHVEEYRTGGDSGLENIWIVCSACHRLIDWTRTYLNRK